VIIIDRRQDSNAALTTAGTTKAGKSALLLRIVNVPEV